jgi:hypothetical protein
MNVHLANLATLRQPRLRLPSMSEDEAQAAMQANDDPPFISAAEDPNISAIRVLAYTVRASASINHMPSCSCSVT